MAGKTSAQPVFSGWEGKQPVCRYLFVKTVFTLELELGNSEVRKIPLKVSSDTFTAVCLTHDSL